VIKAAPFATHPPLVFVAFVSAIRQLHANNVKRASQHALHFQQTPHHSNGIFRTPPFSSFLSSALAFVVSLFFFNSLFMFCDALLAYLRGLVMSALSFQQDNVEMWKTTLYPQP
jgi:hypothetical protein